MGVMKPILAKLANLMGNEYNKLKGLRKEVDFLRRELSDMDAILEKLDNVDELDPQAKKWREDIIEMSYNIEDFLDDYMSPIGEASYKVGLIQKASQYLRTFKVRRRLAHQFQEIKALVMEASKRRRRYMFDQCISITAPTVVDPRLSVLYKESASLVGIDAQKNELVNWAMDKGQQLKVMAIVGIGGLGKTTLANEVYREVGGKFNCKAFVSVSQTPEIVGLFNSFLSQLGLGTYSHACQMQDPINDLRGYLQDKRYFVIIDDLWDTRAWDTQCAFPQNNQCSRVVITTRNENVARSCCSNHECIHNMKPLSEQDSRKLFFDRIFGSEDACPTELMKASCEILKKCGGLPLAIITMASMLACQPTRLQGQWEYIQNSLATRFATESMYQDMMSILDLSYKNLPRQLKTCFLYLSSYPEDYEIDKDQLVRRWVAEGFVRNHEGQDVWDVAESYFNELVNRSMIQPLYGCFGTKVYGCRVHDMLLELIGRRCKEDNFLSLVVNDPQTVAEVQDKVIRRLTIVRSCDIDDGKVAKATARNLSQLRSLTMFGRSNWIYPNLEFKSLRVLCLYIFSRHDITIDLTSINQLSRLRYLKVDGHNNHILIPRQIQLQFLETLDLSGIDRGITLQIMDVPHLSHLVVRGGMTLPHWIGDMKSVRTLRGFSIPMDSLESIIGLGELTTLSDLGLYFNNVCEPLSKATWMAALSSSLEKLGNLKQLNVWHGDPESFALCADPLSSLSSSFYNLELLNIRGFIFSKVPKWIGHLQNLCVLSLGVKHIFQEDVAIIGTRLPSLRTLSLRITGVLTESIVIGGSTGFLVVKWFQFDCDRISYLTFEQGAMPELQVLKLVFDGEEWDKAAPGGLQYLGSLEKIEARRAYYSYVGKLWLQLGASQDEAARIRGVFQEVVDTLPTRPAFNLVFGGLHRPVGEDDYRKMVRQMLRFTSRNR
ncbi:unnamed protein product [Urochloa decumbens]|uniref:Uncharacterized protein n=1 Tax=Urochloa decumbens TaxID=240449 RepID=A0ABC9C0F3_9POAL